MKLSGEEFIRVSQLRPEQRNARPVPSIGVITTASARQSSAAASVAKEESSSDFAVARRMAQGMDMETDIREDVVASLRERIEAGTYVVSGEQVAEMLIRRMMADRVR